MAGRQRNVVFNSKVPTLIGEIQQRHNRFITVPYVIEKTGLARNTVLKWISPNISIKYLDGQTVKAFREFFSHELGRRVLLDELVEEIETQP